MQSGPMIDDLSFQQELEPDEQVLWWGKPDPTHMVKTGNTQQVRLIFINSISVIIQLAFTVFLAQLFNEVRFASIGLEISMRLLVLIGLASFFYHLYSLYWLLNQRWQYITNLKKTLYAITNQRVIVMTILKQGATVHSFTRDDIGQITCAETGGGWGDISYGKARHLQQGNRLLIVAKKLVGISNVHMVEDILSTTFKR